MIKLLPCKFLRTVYIKSKLLTQYKNSIIILMKLSEEQKNFILKHLRRPENDLAISAIVEKIALEANKLGLDINSDYAQSTALLMNIGETNPEISYIYASDFSWKDHPEARQLNAKHGEYSVNMALDAGIPLTEDQKQIISGHSQNKYPNNLALIIKSAEICRATESPRWSRGVKKEAAQSWNEVSSILEEEGISSELIQIVADSYGKERFGKDKEKSHTIPESER